MEHKPLSPQKKKIVFAICAAVLLIMIYFLLFLSGDGQSAPEELESRMEEVLSAMRGVGEVRVVICYTERTAADESVFAERAENLQEISGVVVVAEGAEDIRVRMDLLNAVSSLTGIGTDRVEILY